MASITTLLATDSLASSRIVINDNFKALNDDLNDVTNLLNPTSQTLSISGGASASSLNITAGGSNKLSVSNTDIIAGVDFTANGAVILEERFRHSVVNPAISLPNANQFAATTYVLDAAALSGTNLLANGDQGQEITLIANGGNITFDPVGSNIAGATQITINDNGTLTLRFVGANWYIISDFNCTII
jgi:hypothetical protein